MGFSCLKRPLYSLQADVVGSLRLRGLAWLAHDQLLLGHDLPRIILARPDMIGRRMVIYGFGGYCCWYLSRQSKQSIDMKQQRLNVRIVPKFVCKKQHWVVMVPCGSCFDFSLVNEMALVVGVPKIWLCKGQSPRMAHRQSSTAFTSVILRSVEQKKR